MPKSFKIYLCSSCVNDSNTSSKAASGSLAQADSDIINHYCSDADFQYYVDSQVYKYIYGSSTDDQTDMANKDILPIFGTCFTSSTGSCKIFNTCYLAHETPTSTSNRFNKYILPIFKTSDVVQLCQKAFGWGQLPT